MTDSDLTLKVLVEMRNEMRGLRTDFNGLRSDFNERLRTLEHHAAETNQRLERLEYQAGQTNQRLEVIEHTMVDFGTQVVILGRYMKNTVARYDSDVEKLETKS